MEPVTEAINDPDTKTSLSENILCGKKINVMDILPKNSWLDQKFNNPLQKWLQHEEDKSRAIVLYVETQNILGNPCFSGDVQNQLRKNHHEDCESRDEEEMPVDILEDIIPEDDIGVSCGEMVLDE
jgi:hypothetical protein